MNNQTYTRGQVEWALWRAFRGSSWTAPEEVAQIFRTRIKRLLELDRLRDYSDAEVPPQVDYGFAPPPNRSGETAYGLIDTFCLAIALDLLDAGFKQLEIVFLMRYLRPDLESRFPHILSKPPLLSCQLYLAEEYSDWPPFEENNIPYADKRHFLILQKIEMTEIIPATTRAKHKHPIHLKPIFCTGIEALRKNLHGLMPHHRRAATILELALTAESVEEFLNKAPVVRRGRPKT